MEIGITKSDFELALPVGSSSHDEVFEKLQEGIELTTIYVEQSILGDAGDKILNTAGEGSTLLNVIKKYICIYTFLQQLRQLDLILTPTGFGIVSTQELSPASKQRVDALEGELRTSKQKTFAIMLSLLRSPAWGVTSCAINNIRYIYNEYYFFFSLSRSTPTYQDWDALFPNIEVADEYLRTIISNKQMDDIVSSFRQGNEAKYINLIHKIIHFTDVLEKRGLEFAKKQPLQSIIATMDADLNTYKLYADSTAYQANHYENFHNTKESSAFLFNG